MRILFPTPSYVFGAVFLVLSGCSTITNYRVTSKMEELQVGDPCIKALDAVGDDGSVLSGAGAETRIGFYNSYVICRNDKISHMGKRETGDYGNINVESYTSDKAAPKKVAIVSSKKDVPSSSLKFRKRQGKYVERILESFGYEIVPEDEAEVLVYVFWDLVDLTSEEEITTPVYGLVSPGSTTTFRSASGNYIGSATSDPIWGQVGTQTRRVKNYKFLRKLAIEALDAKDLKKNRKVTYYWQTFVNSAGYLADLDSYLPKLAASAINYIGYDAKVRFHLYFNDPAIDFVLGEPDIDPKLVFSRRSVLDRKTAGE